MPKLLQERLVRPDVRFDAENEPDKSAHLRHPAPKQRSTDFRSFPRFGALVGVISK
jgi:hypothetical protein